MLKTAHSGEFRQSKPGSAFSQGNNGCLCGDRLRSMICATLHKVKYNPYSCTQTEVNRLISGLKSQDEQLIGGSAWALGHLAVNKPEHANTCMAALTTGLEDKASAQYCARALDHLAKNKPKSKKEES